MRTGFGGFATGGVPNLRYRLVVHSLRKLNGKTDMADNIENLILEHLRAIRSDIGGIKDDVREIKQRLTSLEAAIAGLRRAITPT